MKMNYVKPSIIVERFALSQNITNGCNAKHWDSFIGGPAQWSKTTCGWKDPIGDIYFVDAVAACSTKVGVDDDVFGGICYNNPNPDLAIFGS